MYLNKDIVSKDCKASEGTDKYKVKFTKLKEYTLQLIYENAALCDQVTYLQEKILHIKEENNFLTKKLKHIESIRNVSIGDLNAGIDVSKKLKRNVLTYLQSDTILPKSSPTKLKKQSNRTIKKKQILTVSEEECGQIIFPISLNDELTIHCLGEIVTDRVTYHTENIIYPAGYVSKKIYGNVRHPRVKCLYTCNIIDAGMFPRFEICSDDGLIFTGMNPDECHQKLLCLINKSCSAKVVNNSMTCGADFFGLTNPTVHYLIISLPGIDKCIKYSFKRFNERISAKENILVKSDIEACTSYSSLLKVLPDSYNRDPYSTVAWLSTQ